ncbi:U11/U12 small nuclear ribonucleoprotein 48 kDa protein [Microplitis demolitor]|uniref:U11/U12 small nuclear ribonucleoprotein 48 kDa protein n=1 Tax=Microplitis demolitor TaxID=69319 RepID=UPI00235B6476|nr:U11/U12 small nuclear ribonucleoprotein 48 kDa protein [Microplitis demolitor]
MDHGQLDVDKQLQELKSFTENIDKKLNEITSVLGWSTDSIKNYTPPIICPFDKAHCLSDKRLDEHLEKCLWRAEGYGDSDVPLSLPTLPADSPFCIQMTESLQDEILKSAKLRNSSLAIGGSDRLIPRTSDRLTADFTADERKALYEYYLAHTAQPDIGEDIADLNKPKKSNDQKRTSYLELLAHERDLKRRRAKHRGVHTNKKSQIEILREVINQQMEMLTEYIAEKNYNGAVGTEAVKEEVEDTNELKIKNRHKERKDSEKPRPHSDHSNGRGTSSHRDNDDRHKYSHKHSRRESDYDGRSGKRSRDYEDFKHSKHHHYPRDQDRHHRHHHQHSDEPNHRSHDKYSKHSHEKLHSSRDRDRSRGDSNPSKKYKYDEKKSHRRH